MAEHGDGRCVTVSEMEDTFIDFEDRLEARYMALKEFTIKHLKKESSRVNGFEERLKAIEEKMEDAKLQELDDSLSSLRTEFEELKGTTSSPFLGTTSSPFLGIDRFRALNTPELVGSENEGLARASSSGSSSKKKKIKLGRRSVETVSPAKFIEDIKDDELKEVIQKYYTSKLSLAERLSPVQMAFVTYFFEELRRGEYSARADVISQLYMNGRDCGMWPDGWQPDNIKGTFKEYLKEKVRNLNKKNAR